jgi:hypothetical protein
MEKQKREVLIGGPVNLENRRSNHSILAVILIVIGILFLFANLGLFSVGDIGAFFGSLGGSVGSFFGNLGGEIGHFFGNLGSEIGRFFGGLGGAIGRLWPLIIILIGVLVLFRRGASSSVEDKSKNFE